MIRNYIKVAIRNLFKDSFYSFINVFGLSIGITACLLILLYVHDELSYDKFHTDHDRIYRVTAKANLGEAEAISMGVSSAPLAERLINDVKEIESITRLRQLSKTIKYNKDVFREEDMLYVDSSFFDVFDFEVLLGDPHTMLREPFSIVMTEETAVRYFGSSAVSNGSALGKQIQFDDETYQLTGLVKDVPTNSHFTFDLLVSIYSSNEANNPYWLNMDLFTYLKLRKGVNPSSLDEKFMDIVMAHIIPQVVKYMNMPAELSHDKAAAKNFFHYILQPITSIHLHSNLRGELGGNSDISYVYIFSAIAIFIIIIACINFMNLATCRGAKRAIEVGIRKTLGSQKRHLVWQFMIESILFSFMAMIIALGLTEAVKHPFSNITGKALSFNVFEQPWILGMIVGLVLFIGLLSGSYPAFYLTRFKPIEVLKNFGRSGNKNSLFRNSLVVLQFAISTGLIVCTILVYKQMNFISDKNLGFDKENVIVIENGRQLGSNQQAFKNELIKNSTVLNVSFSQRIPSVTFNSPVCTPEGEDGIDIPVFTNEVDYDFLNTYKMELASGRNFSPDFPSDSSAILINESAVQRFGWVGAGVDPVGKYVSMINPYSGGRAKMYVVGVVKDFNYESLKSTISPNVMFLTAQGNFISIRIKSSEHSDILSHIKSTWKTMAPDAPFQYAYLDQRFEELYQTEQNMSLIFSIFTSMAIFIACLGLLGLAAYTTEQRTKEIGIRKTMGASVSNVVGMLNKEFIKLVAIALVMASPIAWYLMHNWLGNFVYRTEIGIWPFVLAGGLAISIALITVGVQSFKAATANPVDSLRNE